RLEKIITATLLIGLALLTVGVGIGAAFVEAGTAFWSDSKTIWSFLVWAMYCGLLLSHLRFDQRGRRYAWSAIVAFGFVILTVWGTNLLSGIHNPIP
ncbi:MAG: cytochrome c biogenesis protein CcsA, partial [Verrucomicrobiota bacterium]|nr:cytochrome c biogenesis protein CcsA [Verrucomicrobiota bacterium]